MWELLIKKFMSFIDIELKYFTSLYANLKHVITRNDSTAGAFVRITLLQL